MIGQTGNCGFQQPRGAMGMGEYITCGTMFKQDEQNNHNAPIYPKKRNISKDRRRDGPGDLER